MRKTREIKVAPFAGAWIEIVSVLLASTLSPSLPSRERGLKLNTLVDRIARTVVAPFAGAWIEINWFVACVYISIVAPFAGAWIEISQTKVTSGMK